MCLTNALGWKKHLWRKKWKMPLWFFFICSEQYPAWIQLAWAVLAHSVLKASLCMLEILRGKNKCPPNWTFNCTHTRKNHLPTGSLRLQITFSAGKKIKWGIFQKVFFISEWVGEQVGNKHLEGKILNLHSLKWKDWKSFYTCLLASQQLQQHRCSEIWIDKATALPPFPELLGAMFPP